MPQTRLFVRAGERDAARMLDAMSAVFEDEGYPLATMEIDEKADIWEASIYVECEEIAEIRERLAECLKPGYGAVDIETEELPDIDWVTKSLEGLRPVRAGRFLVHGSHDRVRVRPSDIAIEIEAGRAFGTGHHGTTAGCLEMIGRSVARRQPAKALDLGTGSGVLAIALARLSPAAILATDIDPVATGTAKANARLNGAAQRVAFATAAGLRSPAIAGRAPFDLVIANILARPLMRMAPELKAALSPGGELILSGILAGQRWKVLSAFNAQRLYHRETLWREGWVTLRLS
jgi:ribosomal protein L11 methyltransferase